MPDEPGKITKVEPPPSPLRQVVRWILDGHDQADVLEAIAKTWPRTKARPLIVAAIAEIAKSGKPDADLIRGFAVQATREIYRKSLEVGDHQTALRALKQLVDLSRG